MSGAAPAPAGGATRTALDELCDAVGIQRRYEAAGRLHEAPLDAVLEALEALGAPIRRPDDAAAALRAVEAARWQRVVEPVTVSWEGGAPGAPVRVMGSEVERPMRFRLTREDGTTEETEVPADDVAWEDAAELEGRVWRRGRLPLPVELPPGHHDLTVAVGAREDHTRLIRAPTTTWEPPGPGSADGRPPRAWGVFLPLWALPSPKGVADVGDLGRLARWTARRGGRVLATLPLYAQFLEPGRAPEPSPYAPVSRLFWNELYLDLERAPGLEGAPEARRILASDAWRRAAGDLGAARRVDYAAVAELRRPVLTALADAAAAPDGSDGLAGALARWARAHPDALRYARFRAFGEGRGRAWRDWPDAARSGDPTEGDADPAAVRRHLYAQMAMDVQIEALGRESPCALYLDLPLGSHPDGYDTWRFRDLFADGFSGGAPPDAFFRGGQDWGFPPVHPGRSRAEGHAYLRRCLQRIMEVSGLVRLDHVMGLHRLFWVPAGGRATDGVYVRYPSEELYALLCLASHRHRCEVVGEDLGTVPPEVGTAMERHRLKRMWLLPFEVGEELREPALRTVASFGSHDLPPFAGYWRGADVRARVEQHQLDEAELPGELAARAAWRRALARVLEERDLLPPGTGLPDGEEDAERVLVPTLRLLGRTPARLVLVSLEDLWLEEEPQNQPGTAGPSNWTRRTRLTLEEIEQDPRVEEALRALDRARDEDTHLSR